LVEKVQFLSLLAENSAVFLYEGLVSLTFFVFVQLDLFTTLKALGFLGAFLLFVGHRILSHLASTSAKLKSA
jgi:oligosaccharyltransferase complex subunit delta (ribophorin II)